MRIISKVTRCEVLYFQPNGDGEQVVSFATFADTIEKNDDPFAKRFAQSLREWAEVKAGPSAFIYNSLQLTKSLVTHRGWRTARANRLCS